MDVFVFGPDGGKNWGPDSSRGGLQNVNKTKHNSITPLNISHLRCFVHGRLLDRNRQKISIFADKTTLIINEL